MNADILQQCDTNLSTDCRQSLSGSTGVLSGLTARFLSCSNSSLGASTSPWWKAISISANIEGISKSSAANVTQYIISYQGTKLIHCGRVTQICVFNTVKLVTSASSPQCHSTRGKVSRGITPSSITRVFGEYFLKISVHKNSQRICYKFLKKHSIKVD